MAKLVELSELKSLIEKYKIMEKAAEILKVKIEDVPIVINKLLNKIELNEQELKRLKTRLNANSPE